MSQFDFSKYVKQAGFYEKEAASTPAYRKAHKAQNRARYSALLKADGGRSRSFTGANPALLDAHHYKYVKDRWAADKEDMKWDAATGGNRTEKSIARANAKDEQTKTSALEFGAMLKRSFDFNSISSGIQSGLNNAYEGAKNIYNSKGVQNFINDPTTRAGLTYGAMGAGLGGLYGAINPGEYEDADGQVRRRGRLMGALRGAGAGGAMLGLAGAGAQEGRYQYLKNMMNQDYAANQPEYANGLQGVNRAGMQQEVENWAGQNMPSMQYSPLESYYEGYNRFVNPAMQNAQRLYKHLLGSSDVADTNDGELILPDPNAR